MFLEKRTKHQIFQQIYELFYPTLNFNIQTYIILIFWRNRLKSLWIFVEYGINHKLKVAWSSYDKNWLRRRISSLISLIIFFIQYLIFVRIVEVKNNCSVRYTRNQKTDICFVLIRIKELILSEKLNKRR